MMTSKERIGRILNFQTPDRIGIKDLFWDETRASWHKALESDPDDYFDYDIRTLNLEESVDDAGIKAFFSGKNKERFLALSFSEPFQRYVGRVGLMAALEDIAKNPKGVFRKFKDDLDGILSRAIGILDKGYEFDGLWLFGDLAHNGGTFFSPEFYKKYLFCFHKEICYFFASYGIPTILHSDGNIAGIIPLLIEAGFKALHPIQYSAGLDIGRLKREYKKRIAFFGNFDMEMMRFPRMKLKDALLRRLEICKEGGGYIFGLDSPLGPHTNLEDYKFIMDTVKEHGRY